MPNYRRAKTEGGTYFFTVVTYQRQTFLCLDESRAILKATVQKTLQSHPFHIDAWVLLPDHMHCLWTLPEGDNKYSTRWTLIKKEFTKNKNSLEDTRTTPTLSESRRRHREGVIWQRCCWEHQIKDDPDYKHHMDYVRYNPVNHGLVKYPVNWPYSTFHRHVAQESYDASWGGVDPVSGDGVGHE